MLTASEDAYGQMQASPESALRVILHSIGFDASSEVAAAASLDAAETRQWKLSLAPMYVVAAEKALHLEMSARADAAARAMHRRIFGEDGRETAGTVIPVGFPVTATGTALQGQADMQLVAAAQAAKGLGVGLSRALAVGAPHWRRRLAMELDALGCDTRFGALARMLEDEPSSAAPRVRAR